ncbi:MAG: glycosyltransferase [Chloroflexi bacterium]|nr:glycosyltransferase [Chloroflexota bacterium]
MNPDLSIIIPIHNEERRLPLCMARLMAYFQEQTYDTEIILVENGSQDQTGALAEQYAEENEQVRVLHVAERGKGRAVRAGMLAAVGEWRFICDVDLSMPIEEIEKFWVKRHENYDVLIGTREGAEANRVGEPHYRHWMGRIATALIKCFALSRFEDTQCGFKMFSAAAAAELFPLQRLHGIGFDVELLFIALRRGHRVTEIPITWYFDPDSRMHLVKDSLHLLKELWLIRRHARRGDYDGRVAE